MHWEKLSTILRTKHPKKPKQLVDEVVTLLDAYAPSWYGLEVQKRAKCEPGSGRRNAMTLLRELHSLLEDYSPMWYTERLQAELETALNGQGTKRKPRRKK